MSRTLRHCSLRGAPLKTSACQVISKSTNPAATTVAFSSASSRAPAIQTHPQIDLLFRVRWHHLVHQDIPDLEATKSVWFPGHLLQGSEFVWQQVQDSVGDDHMAQLSGTGNDSAKPSRNSTLPAPASRALYLAIWTSPG